MRSYSQYCSLARALDVVGDRWTLLIVRELLIRQPCRYTDLAYGLPGIATNLLAERLRQLDEHGIVLREVAPPPIATTLFRLTPRGEELREVVAALGLWGRPLLAEPIGDAEFRSHWLVLPLERRLVDRSPDDPPVTIEVRTGDQPLAITTNNGGVTVWPGPATNPDAVMEGEPTLIIGVLSGRLDLEDALAAGLHLDGAAKAIYRIRGEPETTIAGSET